MAIKSLPWLCGLLLMVLAAQATADDKQLQIQQQKRAALQQSISQLKQKIKETREEKDSLVAELARAEQDIGRSIAQLRELETQQRSLGKKLNKLLQKQQQLHQHLTDSRNKLAQLLRSAYAMGRQERLKLFLNQQDPAMLSRLLSYHDYISKERARQLQLLTNDLEQMKRVKNDILQQQLAIEKLHQQQLENKNALQQRQQQRRKLLHQFDARLQQQGEKLRRWQENERQLANLLQQLQNALNNLELPEQKGFRESKGKLIWPLKGRLRKTFGAQKIGNLRWDGVIISAREGQKVHSIHPGRVAWADWLRGYGLLIIVEHGDGYMSLYGNNQSLFKETGDWVESGEVIAQASASDQRTMGLYFGIRYKGKALNPGRWCRKSGR